MRILYWTDWFLPSIGGVEVFTARLVPALAERGHEVTVIAGHHRDGLPARMEFKGVTVHRFPFHQALAAGDLETTFATLGQVASLHDELQPDVLHLNTLGPSVLFQRESSKHAEAPVLLTMHSPVGPDAVRTDTLYGQALQSAAWVNCNSRAVHADLCGRLPDMRDRSSVTYYGMDEPDAQATPRPVTDPVVLGFGRLVEDKGFDTAVLAFAEVRHRFPHARLVLAGEGPARAGLMQLAESSGLREVVEFRGALAPEEIPALINDASVVVVPSRWDEPFGLVALEAALMERPVVASRVGGLVEAVEDETTGIIVDADDPAALATAVIRLLTDPEEADRMGSRGRERARRLFGWDRCVDEYERLYEVTRDSRSNQKGG